MEEITELLLLSGFAPLLQIWGGICLLFFYTDFITKSPIQDNWLKSLQGVGECCTTLLTPKYQELLPEGINPDSLIGSIKQKIASHSTGPFWQNVRSSVYNLAKFSFFHVVILLFYIGFETFSSYEEMYHVLLLIGLIALIYIPLNFLFYKKSFIQSNWGLYTFVAIMVVCLFVYPILYIHCDPFQAFFTHLGISKTAVTYITLIISIVAYLLALLAYFIRGIITTWRCSLAIKRIKRDFGDWTAIPLNHIPLRIRLKLLSPKNDGDYLKKTGRDQIEGYLKVEIESTLMRVTDILG